MAHEEGQSAAADRPGRRLDSWKEIAAYLGRDVRTVQRWERSGHLPVHRLLHSKRGSVFAYSSELDAWRDARDPVLVTLRPADPAASEVMRWGARLLVVTACVLVLLVFGLSRRGPAESLDPVIPVAPHVYESYLKGLFSLAPGDRAGVEQSVRYLEATIAADRTFAPAYVQLATAYQTLGSTGTGARPVADVQPKAALMAKRALDLDPQLPAAHSSLASAYQQAWRWADAEEGYRRALAIDPDDATAHEGLAWLLIVRGRTQEGLTHARRARELDPLTIGRTVSLAWFLYHARRYDEAIRELQTVLATDPDRRVALWFLGFVLIDTSRLDEAVETLEHLTRLWDRNPAALGLLARAYGRAGRRQDALKVVDELNARQSDGYVPPAPFVHAYIGLGDRDKAFAALDRAYRERSNIVQSLKTHPLYDPIRDDARFADLVHRVGLD
jgi:tetratricopeptide (TPR) repeat protein